jgi:hypothetical protein
MEVSSINGLEKVVHQSGMAGNSARGLCLGGGCYVALHKRNSTLAAKHVKKLLVRCNMKVICPGHVSWQTAELMLAVVK